MTDLNRIRNKFNGAQRALLANLFGADDSSLAYVQLALDQMNQAFNELLLTTFLNEPAPSDPVARQELLCAHAVNLGDNWENPRWHVAYVNGEPVSAHPSVTDFTRQMIAEGWRTTSPSDGTTRWNTPSGEDVIPLYFCRDTVSVPKWLEIEIPILSSN